MAAKGSVLKQEIAKKILTTFPGSFLYNDGKEIRINGTEEGEKLQIKVVLTCSKTIVDNDNDTSQSSEKPTEEVKFIKVNEAVPQEPTEEEKERLAMLLNKLGL